MEAAPRSSWHLAAVASAFVLCVWQLGTFGITQAPLVTDVRYYVYFAWRVAEGAVPHVDFFGNKTQLAALAGGLFYRIGDALGADPLLALRTGYVAIAVCGGMLAFAIHRRLSGRELGGLIGAVAYCSFPLLGILPTIGNIPKLLMAVAASGMGLLVYQRRWFWAGVAGAVAFMDWQVGALAGVGAGVGALLYREDRLRATARVVFGGVAGLAVFLAYYALHGGLRVWYEQAVVASFFRGSRTLTAKSVDDRWHTITKLAERGGADLPVLFYLSFVGFVVAAVWLWQKRGGDAGRMLAALCVYHLGVVAFSLTDFQLFGDFFILLHSVVFFLALAWNGAFELLRRLLQPTGAPAGRVAAVSGAAVLTLAIALGRPGPLRADEPFPFAGAGSKAALVEQVEVAEQIGAALRGRSLLFLAHAEMAFLLRHENPLPFIYWNTATWTVYRASERESKRDAARRIVMSLDPDAYAYKDRKAPFRGYESRRFESASGNVGVTLFVRAGLPLPEPGEGPDEPGS